MDVLAMKAKHTLLKEYAYAQGEIDRGYNNRTLYVNLSFSGTARGPTPNGTIRRTRSSSRPDLWPVSPSIPDAASPWWSPSLP
jgi:hypothetical protein